VDRRPYSVPYQLVHERVEVRYTSSVVEAYYKGRRVASHRRRFDHQPATLAEHMPSSHRAHAEWTPSRLIGWAEKTGPATGRLVAGILRSRPHPEQGYRACLGIMRLGRLHGDERLEAACARAERLRSYSYRTVKNILASGQERLPLEDEQPAPAPTSPHHNIRCPLHYAAEETSEC
jgi:transposase